jgi:hypothetical protein
MTARELSFHPAAIEEGKRKKQKTKCDPGGPSSSAAADS